MRYFRFYALFLVILAVFSSSVLVQAQTNSLNVVPPSPNVAALGKYGDVPVSPYTGVPQIIL